MTLNELIDALESQRDAVGGDSLVAMSKDPEGSDFYTLHSASDATVDSEADFLYLETLEPNTVCLWPGYRLELMYDEEQ